MNANRPRRRWAIALLLAASACQQQPAKQIVYCPVRYSGPVTDTVVLDATPARGRMGQHLQVWLQVPSPRPDLGRLQLFIDGHPVPGLAATQIGARCAVRDAAGAVVAFQEVHEFVPVRTDATRETWAHLLGSPDSFVDTVRVGAGLPNGPEFKALGDTVNRVAFTVADEPVFWSVAVALAALLALLVWAGASTAILRDPAPLPQEPETRPYSLAKVVMAMWTFLILAGFFGIWLITGDHRGILTEQSLLLLGIVGVSTAASVEITRRQNRRLAEEGRELRLEAATYRSEAEALNVQARALAGTPQHAPAEERAAARAERAGYAEAALRALEAEAPVSRGFFTDILSDANGAALHRFQNLAWNVALAIVFLLGTYRALVFPEFDSTLLVLLGISEGLYLGLKPYSPPKPPGPEAARVPRPRWWRRQAA